MQSGVLKPSAQETPVRARISVALCTFNGERFLPQQLSSILRQTRLPDEVVLLDDCSTDKTVPLLQEFAAEAPFPVFILHNPQNIGSVRSFEKAIWACTGDFIALSDQDDVWRPRRLEQSAQALLAHPEAGLVFSDGEIIDESGMQTGVRLWENFAFDAGSRERLRAGDYIPLARRTFVTGATVMFRSCFREFCFPVGPGWVHDSWMAAMIACLSSLCMVDEPLIDYRQHSSQQIGLGPQQSAARKRRSVEQMAQQHWASFSQVRDMLNVLCAAIGALPLAPPRRATGAAYAFHTEREFLNMRMELPVGRLARVPIIWRERRHYRQCAKGWLSMLWDTLLPKDAARIAPLSPKDISKL